LALPEDFRAPATQKGRSPWLLLVPPPLIAASVAREKESGAIFSIAGWTVTRPEFLHGNLISCRGGMFAPPETASLFDRALARLFPAAEVLAVGRGMDPRGACIEVIRPALPALATFAAVALAPACALQHERTHRERATASRPRVPGRAVPGRPCLAAGLSPGRLAGAVLGRARVSICTRPPRDSWQPMG
jgi:hypothetical protein